MVKVEEMLKYRRFTGTNMHCSSHHQEQTKGYSFLIFSQVNQARSCPVEDSTLINAHTHSSSLNMWQSMLLKTMVQSLSLLIYWLQNNCHMKNTYIHFYHLILT